MTPNAICPCETNNACTLWNPARRHPRCLRSQKRVCARSYIGVVGSKLAATGHSTHSNRNHHITDHSTHPIYSKPRRTQHHIATTTKPVPRTTTHPDRFVPSVATAIAYTMETDPRTTQTPSIHPPPPPPPPLHAARIQRTSQAQAHRLPNRLPIPPPNTPLPLPAPTDTFPLTASTHEREP